MLQTLLITLALNSMAPDPQRHLSLPEALMECCVKIIGGGKVGTGFVPH